MLLEHAAESWQGAREYQEDSFHVSDLGGQAPHAAGRLFVVADGMGGHAGGAVASRVVIEEVARAFQSGPTGPATMRRAIDASTQALADCEERDGRLRGLGSTLIGATITAEGLEWVSVGDSPLWLFRRGELRRLNADHSYKPVLERMVELGEISREAAASDPQRHVLRSALTRETPDLVDVPDEPMALEKGDLLLLASDGIQTLADAEIAALCASARNVQALCQGILDAVKQKAAAKQDNATLIVIRVLEPIGSARETDEAATAVARPTAATSRGMAASSAATSARTNAAARSSEQVAKRGHAADLTSNLPELSSGRHRSAKLFWMAGTTVAAGLAIWVAMSGGRKVEAPTASLPSAALPSASDAIETGAGSEGSVPAGGSGAATLPVSAPPPPPQAPVAASDPAMDRAPATPPASAMRRMQPVELGDASSGERAAPAEPVNAKDPSEASEKPAPQTATLSFETVPADSTVLVNGKVLADSGNGTSLPPGSYTISVQRAGYVTKKLTLALAAGQHLQRRVELCRSQVGHQCKDDAVWWSDSCGNAEALEKKCQDGEKCSDGACIATAPACVANASARCIDGKRFSVDSCGKVGSESTGPCDAAGANPAQNAEGSEPGAATAAPEKPKPTGAESPERSDTERAATVPEKPAAPEPPVPAPATEKEKTAPPEAILPIVEKPEDASGKPATQQQEAAAGPGDGATAKRCGDPKDHQVCNGRDIWYADACDNPTELATKCLGIERCRTVAGRTVRCH